MKVFATNINTHKNNNKKPSKKQLISNRKKYRRLFIFYVQLFQKSVCLLNDKQIGSLLCENMINTLEIGIGL